MIDTTPTPLFLNENPAAVPIPKAVQQAYVWAFGGLATLALLVVAVATQSNADAARITGLREGGASAPATLVNAFAVAHGRPGAF
ncbi:hypothetical protein [Methylobacterium gossipiicola]|uniref:Uncharacterized protein n=1 Tax=Methylobacterium gossipiicola TaxID=582675 RepID=A0A1I2TMC6_9HYPH|nr:hypothetical protein [Methylobacterium gossipiicola]SFG63606.1 hypothetical protein SAMN05192565_10752 [Methylobacterium gossipiicola]